LNRTAPVLPLLPGTPQRQSHDYTRHGTTNLYAALEVASGMVISQMTPRHRAIEFKRFLARIDHAVPAELEADINAWIQAWNDDPKPFVWTKTADEILDKMRRFGLRTQQVHGS